MSVQARNCEKSHTCKHEPHFKLVEESNYSYTTYTGIGIVCCLCRQRLDSVDFEDIEDNQEILKAIYDLIKAQQN